MRHSFLRHANQPNPILSKISARGLLIGTAFVEEAAGWPKVKSTVPFVLSLLKVVMRHTPASVICNPDNMSLELGLLFPIISQ